MAKQKEKEEETGSKSVLHSLMEGSKDDHYNNFNPQRLRITSGSLNLDVYTAITSSAVVRLIGAGPELGKTSQCLVFADNFHKTFPKAKTIFCLAEGRLSDQLKKRSGMKFVSSPDEWEYNTIFEFKCNIFETVANTIETLLKEMHGLGEQLCIIIDSLDGLILKNDIAKPLDENQKVAGVPLLTKRLFKRIALPISSYDCLFLITSQYSADIKLDPYSAAPPRQGYAAGGSAVGHQADYVISYKPRYAGDYILENDKEKPDPIKNKILGVFATIEIKKSATDNSGIIVKVPIKKGRIGSAIWVEKEVADLILAFQLATRKGAWITFSSKVIEDAKAKGIELQESVQGISGLYNYMETDEKAFNWFFNKIKNIISE